MIENEKKYSDYQKNECEDLKSDTDGDGSGQVLDPKICPTCTPNPNFKLDANWWEIEEGYLNEAECEYHIRIYQAEAETELKNRLESGETNLALKEDVAFDLAITKLLVQLKKPINAGTKQQLFNATFSLGGAEDTYETGNTLYKKAWRIRIPAFNFDQIQPTDSEESDEPPTASSFGNEIILEAQSLNKNIRRLNTALDAFSIFYAMAQKSSNSFVIRQEQDIILRINYDATKRKLKKFKELLNNSLLSKGYPKIQHAGMFKSKRAEKIKITFEEGKPYKLKNIWALPDDGCAKYEDLKISSSSPLRTASYDVIYSFLANLDLIINDLTAAEPKPWLDWTLQYFYPKYIVDYGNLVNVEDARAGLQCLIEEQLGIGNGQVIDSVTSEIMSAFASLEDELAKQACKSVEDKILRPHDIEKQEDPETLAERERILKDKFKKKFENNCYKSVKKYVKRFDKTLSNLGYSTDSYEDAAFAYSSLPAITRAATGDNTIRVTQMSGESEVIDVADLITDDSFTTTVKIPFVDVDSEGEKIKIFAQYYFTPDTFFDEFEKGKVSFSEAAYRGSQNLGLSFGQEILVSDEYQLGLKAIKETIKLEDNSFMASIKESMENRSDFDIIDLIPTIGLCGMTKTAGKALECLLKGVSFDDFLSVLIEKTFDFMEVNTLSLFFNGLPEPVRQQINEAIAKEFGANMDISVLFAIKNSSEGSDKLKDFLKSKQKGKNILKILKKQPSLDFGWEDRLSEEDKRTFISIFKGSASGAAIVLSTIMSDAGYNRERGVYLPVDMDKKGKADFLPPTSPMGPQKKYKPETWVLKSIRKVIKDSNANDETFLEQTDRIFTAVGSTLYESALDLGTAAMEAERARARDRAERNQQFIEGTANVDEDGNPLPVSLSSVGSTIVESVKWGYQSAVDAADRVAPNLILEEDELDIYQTALNSFNETALGAKVDVVFDIVFSYLIDYITDFFSLDEIFEELKSYPVVDFLLDTVQSILLASCPKTPIIYPPPTDILKTLKVDVCDPTFKLALPVINVPSINYRFHIELKFSELFREALTRLYTKAALAILNRIMNALEGSLCNLIEGVGGFAIDGIRDGTLGQDVSEATNRFLDSLNEAFCNDSQNSDTLRDRAEELADALFSPLTFNSGGNYEGSSNKVTNVISAVATQDEFLEAMVARDGEENQQFNKRISNAVRAFAPEVETYLGSPDQVAYFFRNLGSYLPEDDKQRIRDLLEAGVPNLPISDAICLTNDQLDEWDRLREDLLKDFPNPDEIVRNLNDQTLAALGDAMDDVGDLSTDGPFVGPLIDELEKDVCNPNNILNDVSTDDLSKAQLDEVTQAFYDNVTRSLIKGFADKNGLLGEALADVEGRKEFSRIFRKLFNPNYTNSQKERDDKHESKSPLGQFIMDALTEESASIGSYPSTVGLDQRNQITAPDSILFNFTNQKTNKRSAKNIVFNYKDTQETLLNEFTYRLSVAASNLRSSKKVFGYNLQVIEKINDEQEYVELNFNVPITVSDSEDRYLRSIGFDYKDNRKNDIRKAAFNSIIKNAIPLNTSHDSLYEKLFKVCYENTVLGILSNYGSSDPIPNGYQFGYVNEDLTKDDFIYRNPDGATEYNLDEKDKTLGKYGNSRIVILDPALYGGRYSNPPFYVEPRQFTGWMEIATKAFTSAEGCEPSKPPLISFNDISNRTKVLNNSLRNDPRLTQDPDCVSVKPFDLLIDSKNEAKIDGVVRTTIRTYIAEYFLKGYGLFSNIETREQNFDSALSIYMISKMKAEMSQLGTMLFSSKISIKQDRYWYTFLEQSVEAYQRSTEVDGVSPPPAVAKALQKIQLGLDKFVPIDKRVKKLMKERIKKVGYVTKPNSDYDPIKEISKGTAINGLQAVAFRLTTDDEEKQLFFNGEKFEDIKTRHIRNASLKKLRFFQKIYFIKLFEREATLIMAELVREELKRFGEILVDGLTDKPYYRDLYKSLLGMKSFFPNSSCRIGLNDFYIGKQTGDEDAGDIPDVNSNISTAPIPVADKPQFVVQKYARIIDRQTDDIPLILSTRPNNLRGVVSLEDLADFVDDNIEFLQDNYISDYFGNLSFTYKVSILELFESGYANEESINKLFDINIENSELVKNKFSTSLKGFDKIKFRLYLNTQLRQYIAGNEIDDLELLCDESFFGSDAKKPNPHSTTGESGIKYGIRVCLLLPEGHFNSSQIESLRRNASFSNLSRNEKAYLFNDDSVMIPISSAEVDVIDDIFDNFDPFSGNETYDLECLVNKLVLQPSFVTMFDKILNIRQATTMTAIYAIESFMPSLGRADGERTEEYLDSLDYEDSWDGTINSFGKNFLRREFSSLYLSSTFDGQLPDKDDQNSLRLLNFGNPFNQWLSFGVNIPWWIRRRQKTKVYDANGVECARPEKDLT